MRKTDGLYDFIIKNTAKISGLPLEGISEDSNFQADLGMDSLQAVEILYNIEKKYKIKLHDIELDEIQSPKKIYDICRKIIYP